MAKEEKLSLDELLVKAQIKEEDQPYDVPSNWVWVSFGNVATFIGGGTPSKSNSRFWNGSIKWASVKDIKGNFLYNTDDLITQEGLDNSSSNVCEIDELLLVTRISPGKIIIAKDKIAINQDLKIVRTKLGSKYLYFYTSTIEQEFIEKSSGSNSSGHKG